MAEHGVSDFLFAKRKAAERFGVTDNAVLPKNVEIEEALAEYQRLFGGDSHVETLYAQRQVALQAMKRLKEFEPRLVGTGAQRHGHRAFAGADPPLRGPRRERRDQAHG